MPTERMGPPPGASPPMRMTASWSGPNLPNTSLRRAIRAQWRAPLRSSRRRITGPSDAELSKKGPSPAHRPSACSGVKALRNTSLAKAASRQAPLAFRSLDPFRALREPDCRRRDEKRPFPLRTKNCQHNPNNRLTGKAPYKFKSASSSDKSATNQAIEVQAGHPGGSTAFKLFATQPCLRSLSFEKALPRAMWGSIAPPPACLLSTNGRSSSVRCVAVSSGGASPRICPSLRLRKVTIFC